VTTDCNYELTEPQARIERETSYLKLTEPQARVEGETSYKLIGSLTRLQQDHWFFGLQNNRFGRRKYVQAAIGPNLVDTRKARTRPQPLQQTSVRTCVEMVFFCVFNRLDQAFCLYDILDRNMDDMAKVNLVSQFEVRNDCLPFLMLEKSINTL